MVPRRPIFIATGGALGVLIRWALLGLADTHSTLAVLGLNIVGSVLVGVLLGRGRTNGPAWSFGALGFCGGLTTFSSFALNAARYLDSGDPSRALGLITSTVLLAIIAARVGYSVGLRTLPETTQAPDGDSDERSKGFGSR